jgi:heme/copper-type cytochrome/quinol oxidase subunit 3
MPRFTVDAMTLEAEAHGHRSLTWWGTIGFIAIEGAGFLLAASAYLMLMHHSDMWPPNLPPPQLGWSTAVTFGMLASLVPNFWLKHQSDKEKLAMIRIGLVVMSAIGAILLGFRALEFTTLNVRWDTNAYGSVVWALLALHTLHLATDVVDTLVLTVLMFTSHGHGKRRMTDAAENAMYWNFVVFAWLPIYGLIYWLPRLMSHG